MAQPPEPVKPEKVNGVQIYLPICQEDSTEWILALTIPHKDIRRLALRPLKWLRFATFAICGAKGDLTATTEIKCGEIVEYDNVTFHNLAGRYYYHPDGEYHLVDCNAINDQCTSTRATARHMNFRKKISKRDVRCVITRDKVRISDAAHIIPGNKGDNYISFVVRERSNLYDGQVPPSFEEHVHINCVENGIFLRKELHSKFGVGEIGFLKTPNFAMRPDDVPRVEKGPIPDHRTTLQYIEKPRGRGVAKAWDVVADWSRDDDEVRPPPSILLDFMYGAAVAKRWKSERLTAMLEEYSSAVYGPVLAKPLPPPPEDHKFQHDDDNANGPDLEPPSNEGASETSTSIVSADLLKTMDHMLFLPMLLKGIPPQAVAAEWQRRDKEAALCSQERSRDKVRQWLGAVSTNIKYPFFERRD